MMRLFVHLLVIAGLVLSTISPACAFVAGANGMTEICGADGIVKTVQLPGALDPESLLKAPKKLPQGKGLTQQCPFCLAFGVFQADIPSVFSFAPAPVMGAFRAIGPGTLVFASAPDLGFTPTGPPDFLFM